MPLHLRQKLRKALRPGSESPSGTDESEGRHVRAGSLREPQSARQGKAPDRGRVNANSSSTGDDLTNGFERLRLNHTNGDGSNGFAPLDPAVNVPGTSTALFDEDPRRPSTGHASRRGHARSASVASEDDPYSERVANRNISPPIDPKNWTHQEDVDYEVTQLAPVTHETRIVNTHEIVEQPVFRDIHNYDVIHRELPVIDVEVLPPRHFVPSEKGDGLVEIPANQVPGGAVDNAAIQRSVKQAMLRERLEPRSAGAS